MFFSLIWLISQAMGFWLVREIVITKTRLYNFDPLKPHFYIVKLGFTGVYIVFLITAQNIDCGYSLELPQWGRSNEYPQSMFWAEIWKISEVFIWIFSVFLEVKFSTYLHRRVFVMMCQKIVKEEYFTFIRLLAWCQARAHFTWRSSHNAN